jgi:HlyD family secretion protein
MRPYRRRLLAALALGLAALVVAALLRPRPVEVELGRVERGPLEVALEEQGEARVEPRFTIAAPVAGRLLRVSLREGDTVRRGDVVALLLPAPLDTRAREQAQAALSTAVASEQEAQARVAEAEAAHRQAETTRARLERLAAGGHLSAETLDQARTAECTTREALDAARHRSQAAAGQVAAARAVLVEADPGVGGAKALELAAPAAGNVLRVFERSERVVAAGTPLVELGDPQHLEVVVEVLSTDAVTLPAGALMLVDAGGGEALRARLRRVEPAAFTKVSPLGVEEQRVRVVGDVLGPTSGVGDRYRVEARIVLWQGDHVLRTPSGAVFRRADGWAAFVAEGGRARLRAVRLGHRTADHVEVVAGLREGETVVLYPPERLADGSRIATSGS